MAVASQLTADTNGHEAQTGNPHLLSGLEGNGKYRQHIKGLPLGPFPVFGEGNAEGRPPQGVSPERG